MLFERKPPEHQRTDGYPPGLCKYRSRRKTRVEVDPDEVEVGTIIVVQPSEKIPIDGVIEEGNTTLNTSALTGESVPRDARSGDEVISGCINMSGLK